MRRFLDNFNWLYVLVPATIIVWLCVGVLALANLFPEQAMKVYADIQYDVIEPNVNEHFKELYPNVFIDVELDQETEDYYVQRLELYMEDLPLYQYDYRIILTDKTLTTDAPYAQGYSIIGVTSRNTRTIKLKHDRFEYSILHEIGHAVDRYEDYSQTAEFQELYNMVEHDTYYTCDAREYFAYCYNMYVVNSLDNPAVKAYFDRLIYGYSCVIGG